MPFKLLKHLLLFVVFFVLQCRTSCSQLSANTTYGPVEGYIYKWVSWDGTEAVDIRAWRGIPFAQPPQGNLRWQPPQPPASWTTPLPCTGNKAYCVQPSGDGSEDCLYLNVFALNEPTDSGPYPVLFYIYGGGLMSGSATEEFGGFLAHAGKGKGVVVVTVSYRLNIFGFLATAELSAEQGGTSGNYGISDQIMALQWVKNNIAFFGGDPSRVTVAGQSSGGTSVYALMASPASKGLFAGAIPFSGSPNITMVLDVAERQNAGIVEASGCAGTGAEGVLACLRDMSKDDLVKLIPSSWNTPGIWDLPKGPNGQEYAGLVIVDGKVVTHSFIDAMRVGLVDVPLLFGNMGYESDLSPGRDVSSYSSAQWQALLDSTFASWPNGAEVSKSIGELYAAEAAENPQRAFDAIVTDYGLFCAQVDIVQQALPPRGSYSSPIYLYENSWGLAKPIQNGGYTIRYAFHWLDYCMLTEGLHGLDNGKYVPEPSDEAAEEFLQSTWFEFISTGRLSTPWSPVNSTSNWPSEYSIMYIQSSGQQMTRNHKADVCSYYDSIGLSAQNYWWCD